MENTKEVVVKFEERINAEVRQQEKLDFRKEKLSKRYMTRILYG